MVVHWPNLPGGCMNDSSWGGGGGGYGGMLSYCRSFLRLPFAWQVRKKCCCCISARKKMLLSVQKEFLRYSIWNLQQIQNLNRIKNLSLEGPFSSNTIIRKQSKENNRRCLEIMEESLLLLSQFFPLFLLIVGAF